MNRFLIRPLRIILMFVPLFILSGCIPSAVQKPAVTSVDDILDKDKAESVLQELFPARAEVVQTPRDALWLGHARDLHFSRVPLREIVKLLSNGRPVHWNFLLDADANPFVMKPPSALTIKDFFDSFANQTNMSYEIHSGVLVWSDWLVTSIELAALTGVAKASISATGGINPDINAGINEFTVETDPYGEIEKLVADILGLNDVVVDVGVLPVPILLPGLGTSEADVAQNLAVVPTIPKESSDSKSPRQVTFHVSRSANRLYISARPNQVREIKKLIDDFNGSVSKRVIISLALYDVQLTASDNQSLNLDLLRRATNARRLIFGSASAGNDSLSITRASRIAGTATAPSRAREESLILNWVERQGHIVRRINHKFETQNNRAVTFVNAVELEFIKSLRLTRSGDGDSLRETPEVDIGTHSIGRRFSFFVTIVSGRISVQMAINERRIVARNQYDLGGNTGSLFDIENVDRTIPLSLANGETRVLTYLKQNSVETNQSENTLIPVITRGQDDNSIRTETVIVISADIVG